MLSCVWGPCRVYHQKKKNLKGRNVTVLLQNSWPMFFLRLRAALPMQKLTRDSRAPRFCGGELGEFPGGVGDGWPAGLAGGLGMGVGCVVGAGRGGGRAVAGAGRYVRSDHKSAERGCVFTFLSFF